MRHLSYLVLDAYDDCPGTQQTLRLIYSPREGIPPRVLLTMVLSLGGCVKEEPTLPDPPVRLSSEHQHDAAVGVALYVCVEQLKKKIPERAESYATVWKEIKAERDFSTVSGAVHSTCVSSAALLSCQKGLPWTGVVEYFATNEGVDCESVAKRVDWIRSQEGVK